MSYSLDFWGFGFCFFFFFSEELGHLTMNINIGKQSVQGCRDFFAALQDTLFKHTSSTHPYLNKAHSDWPQQNETEPRSHKKKYSRYTSLELSICFFYGPEQIVLLLCNPAPASGKTWKSLLHHIVLLPLGSQLFGKWKSKMVSLGFCQCTRCSNWRKCAMREKLHTTRSLNSPRNLSAAKLGTFYHWNHARQNVYGSVQSSSPSPVYAVTHKKCWEN